MFKKFNVFALALLIIGQTILGPMAVSAEPIIPETFEDESGASAVTNAVSTGDESNNPDDKGKKLDEISAIETVEKAEEIRTEEDIDVAQILVDILEDGKEKDALQVRLDVVLTFVLAVEAVGKAEKSRAEEDLAAAEILVNALEDGEEKESLQERLKVIETLSVDPKDSEQPEEFQEEGESESEEPSEPDKEALQAAKAAVEAAEESKTQEDIEHAIDLIEALEDSDEKEDLEARLAVLLGGFSIFGVSISNEDPEKHGFTLELGGITQPNGDPFPEDSLLDPKDLFQLTLNWVLADGHNYVKDDKETFDLPKGILITEGFTGELRDDYGQLVANYNVTTDKKVELTFSDYVETHSNVKGWLGVVSKLDEKNVEVEDGNAILEPIGEEGALEIPIDRGEIRKTIEKEGTPNKGYNADEIDWVVIINKDKIDLKDAKVTDLLPEGTKYKEDSLKVTKLKVGLDGTVLGDAEEVVVTDETVVDGNLSIPLGHIKDAYRIEYVTTVTDEDKKAFVNKATLSDNKLDSVSANGTVTINRGEAIKKKAAKAYNPKTGIIEWEIEFNYNLKDLSDVTLTDKWTPAGKLDLVEGSLVFTEMTIDIDGNAHETSTAGLPDGATLVPGTDQFEVTGITTNNAYKITYQTKVKDRVFNHLEVANTAGFGTESAGSGTGVGTYYGSKSAGKIDYKNKTIDWKIEINHDEFPMEKISVKDTLGDGLTLDEKSLGVTVDGETYTDFTLVEGSPFEVNFLEGFTTDKKIEISYQTSYVADDVPIVDEVKKPTNKAAITWTPEGGSESITKEVTVGTELNEETKNTHWKNGSYDPTEKEITWTIYTNYRENTIGNLIVKDAPQGNQKIITDSVVVKELTIDEDGKITESEPLTSNGATVNEDNTMEVNIGDTNKAYKIEYKTSLAGLSDIKTEYVNKAEVLDGIEKLSDLEAKVGIAKAETYGEKSGFQDGKQIHWSIKVNLGQQKIKDLQLVDTITENQDYLADTIKVYEVKYDKDGNTTIGNEVSSDQYDLTHTAGEQTFTVKWKNEIERAFIVEYSTLFFAGHGEDVTNGYKITGDSISEENESADSSGRVNIQQFGTGGGSGEAGYLVIDKIYTIDSVEEGKLAGAEFDLIDADTGNVLKKGTTDGNGQIDFGRLLFGKYELIERVVPEGYVTPKEKQIITIDKQYDPLADKAVYTITVDNYVPVFAVELTKTDNVDGSLLLPGVGFTLFNSAEEEVGTGTTNGEGKILFEDLKVAGTYYAQETEPPGNYQPDNKKYPVLVGAKDRVPAEMTVTNTLFPGKGTLTKVDAENPTTGLAGAVFEVFSGNQKVDEFRTVEGGVGVTKNLPPGDYTVKEKTPPTGFTGSTTEYTLEIPKANGIAEYPIKTNDLDVSITNNVKTTSIQLTKTDSVNTSQKVQGAKFQISYKSGDYADYFNNSYPNSKTVDTNGSGIATFEDLKPGIYTITELTPDGEYGYIVNSTPFDVEVTYNQVHNTTTVMESVTNKPLANVIVKKEDRDTSFALKDAEFKVTNEDGSKDIRIGLTTNDKGEISITGLPAGKYQLVETKPPTGYELDPTPQDFEVLAGGTDTETINKTFTNNIIKGSVELTKIDGDSGEKLEGVKFTLSAMSFVNDRPTNWTYLDTTLETDGDGYVKFDNLRPGSYKLVESQKYSDEYQDHWREYEFDILLQNDKHEYRLGDVKNYKLVNINVEKKWIDGNDNRPESVTVQLKQNGSDHGDPVEIKADADWNHEFEGLHAVNSEGNHYTYTVEEVRIGNEDVADAPYEVKQSGNAAEGFVFTNTLLTEIPVTKIWKEGFTGNQYRPNSVELELFNGGTSVGSHTLSGDEDESEWKHTFENLPKYNESGTEIAYLVEEVTVPTGYTSSVSLDGLTVTNIQATKSVTVTKEWLEVDAKYRPEQVTIQLKIGNEVVDTHDLSGVEDGWKYTFNNLPTHDKDGVEIEYVVDEIVPDGYTKSLNGTKITNRQNTISVDGKKVWSEVDSAYRPDKVEIILNADGVEYARQDITGDPTEEEWKYEFTNLPTHDKDGVEIEYEVDEVVPDGYTKSLNGTEITNTQNTMSVDGKKVWSEVNSAYRPDKVEIILNADGVEYARQDITGGPTEEEWTYEFTDLPTHDATEKAIVYTVDEEVLVGYEKSVDGTKITNTQKTTSISGTKTWNDEGDPRRPAEGITIQVIVEGETDFVQEKLVTADANGNWAYTFTDLPKYNKSGNEIVYKINELQVPGYVAEIDGYNITNTRTDTTDISVTKEWKDESESERPGEITVVLSQKQGDTVIEDTLQEIKPDNDGNWTHTFEGLTSFDNEGKAYTYTVEEINVDEKYTASEPVWDADKNGYIITNVRTGTTFVEGTKTWLDDNATDRPASITINLSRQVGIIVDEVFSKQTTVEPDENGNWLITDLDEFDENGKRYTYKIVEEVPEGYEATYDGFNITNLRVGTTEVKGTKTWLDDNSEDRPKSIDIKLSRAAGEVVDDAFTETRTIGLEDWTYSYTELDEFNNQGVAYTYSVEEVNVPTGYESTVAEDSYDITNLRVGTTTVSGEKHWDEVDKHYRPDKITVQLLAGSEPKDSVDVTAEADWKYTFADLPQYDDEGIEINYKVKELGMKGYVSKVDEFDITNTQETTTVPVTKIWKDDENEDRPTEIIVQVKDGNRVVQEKELSVTDHKTADNEWNYTFTDLAKFDKAGEEIKYTVTESEISGYETSINGYEITNLRIGTTLVEGTKTWKDDNTLDRPEMIKVNLLQNNVVHKMKEVTAKGDWSFVFMDLDQYDENGVAYEYTVKEQGVPGYKSEVDGFNITNIKSEKTSVVVTKGWKDDNSSERPDSIEVKLLRNGELFKEGEVTAEIDWTYEFEDLEAYDAEGVAYEYTIEEVKVEGYETIIAGYDITNVRVGETTVEGTKTWLDDNAVDRPEMIKVDLLQNGEVVDTTEVTAETDWKYVFSDLQKYDGEGVAYNYVVKEQAVEGYDSVVTDYDITNVRVGETSVEGTKTWVDGDSKDRPSSIVVELLQNGTKISEVVVTAKTNWTFSFMALDKFDEEGVAYTYEINEQPVPGYSATIDGYDITNTVDPVGPTEPESPTKPETPSKPETPKTPEKPATMPQTGEEQFRYMIALGVIFLATGGLILFRRRKV